MEVDRSISNSDECKSLALPVIASGIPVLAALGGP